MKIERLVPQRYPIKVVDELLEVNGNEAHCQLGLRADNCFIEPDGRMAEPGLIEHIAQCASAVAGYRAVAAGATQPPLGFIGEVKNFHCYRRPSVGEILHTTIENGPEVAGVTLITGKVMSGDELLADTKMKIFINK